MGLFLLEHLMVFKYYSQAKLLKFRLREVKH